MSRYWFMGSGEFARRCLSRLHSWRAPDLVVSSLPRPAGRGLKLRDTAVAREAQERGLDLCLSNDVNGDDELLRRFSEESPLGIVVVDFGQMIREPYLSTPSWGCLNVHPSLLPLYRGAAPIQRVLMAGDPATGVTVFRLVPRMDAGPILAQEEETVQPDDTYGSLLERLSLKGGGLLCEALELLGKSGASFREQDHKRATFAPVIQKKEAEVRWSRSAWEINCLIRALNPVPGAFSHVGPKRLKIWKADIVEGSGAPGTLLEPLDDCAVVACGADSLCLREVQPEGRQRLQGASWWRGSGLKEGERLP